MKGETVRVAASGTHDRDDTCGSCGSYLFAKVDEQERIKYMFCGNLNNGCPAALIEVDA